MKFAFCRIINEKKHTLTFFSINENNPNDKKDIKVMKDILSMLPHIEKSTYLIEVELDDKIVETVFLADESSFKDLFEKFNIIYAEDFFYKLRSNEYCTSD